MRPDYPVCTCCIRCATSSVFSEAVDGVGGPGTAIAIPARAATRQLRLLLHVDKNLLKEWDWSERYPEQDESCATSSTAADRFYLTPTSSSANPARRAPRAGPNLGVSIGQHVGGSPNASPHANNQACNDEAIPQAQDAWAPMSPVGELEPDAWHQFLYMGANIPGKAAPLLALPRP